jgi:UDP-N-acetylmuramate: L-alanyl-gamma-D-glutamyl-meso-diaminopimelate ligase
MQLHFIAIGGSAMHNLAIALSRKGYHVTGSDDEIFEPSRTRLANEGIMPETIGWHPDKIHVHLNAVILGMHARADNPELLRAKELGLNIYSYPEYLYEQSKHKKRIVIGGSHGKTTITAMILHAAKKLQVDIDYMVGAQLDGYDCMVRLSDRADMMVLEGDEYLSSPIDRRPKFHLYQPDVALISGIAWDHINVFPTFENYVEQFEIFCEKITNSGVLIYNNEDEHVRRLGERFSNKIEAIPYQTPVYDITPTGTKLKWKNTFYPLSIFGRHNLQNLMGAMYVGTHMGIAEVDFLSALSDFRGAGKRLQKVVETEDFVMYKDFAHSPSKLKATTAAVKSQYPSRKLIACMELHTFSSLKKEFLSHYLHSMDTADEAIVYYNPEVVKHKKLEQISPDQVREGFGGNITVLTNSIEVVGYVENQQLTNTVLLMMSSGTFDGIDYDKWGEDLKKRV